MVLTRQTQQRQRTTFPFLSLPAEIRVFIYDAILSSEHFFMKSKKSKALRNIIQTNAQIRREVYGHGLLHLHCDIPDDVNAILQVPDFILINIRRLTIDDFDFVPSNLHTDPESGDEPPDRQWLLTDLMPKLKRLHICAELWSFHIGLFIHTGVDVTESQMWNGRNGRWLARHRDLEYFQMTITMLTEENPHPQDVQLSNKYLAVLEPTASKIGAIVTGQMHANHFRVIYKVDKSVSW